MYYLFIAAFFSLALQKPALAQRKLDLDDLTVKGELLRDGRLRLRSRESQKMADRVRYRTNYRKEITENLDRGPTAPPPVEKSK